MGTCTAWPNPAPTHANRQHKGNQHPHRQRKGWGGLCDPPRKRLVGGQKMQGGPCAVPTEEQKKKKCGGGGDDQGGSGRGGFDAHPPATRPHCPRQHRHAQQPLAAAHTHIHTATSACGAPLGIPGAGARCPEARAVTQPHTPQSLVSSSPLGLTSNRHKLWFWQPVSNTLVIQEGAVEESWELGAGSAGRGPGRRGRTRSRHRTTAAREQQ